MIKKPVLFIDFDRTICFDRFWRSLPSEELSKVQSFLFVDNRKLFGEWMRGESTSEEINRFVADNCGLDYEYLWKIFVKDCESMRVDISILEKLNGLRDAYEVILMTNNMDCFDRFTLPKLHLNNYFDKIINSYDQKRLKQDDSGLLFKEYCDEVSRAYLIDDSPIVCDVFIEIGGTSLQITEEEDVRYHLDSL